MRTARITRARSVNGAQGISDRTGPDRVLAGRKGARMAEHIREVIVTIEVATNKQTKKADLRLRDAESFVEFQERVAQKISELTDVA
jgi:hypothetical protein